MEEWTSGVKNAIAAIVILVIIGLVFGFVYMATNANDTSQDQLAGQLSSMDNKAFDPYDGTELNGAQVASAISQFKNQDVAVVVETANSSIINYGTVIDGVGSADLTVSGNNASNVGSSLWTAVGTSITGQTLMSSDNRMDNTAYSKKKASNAYINSAANYDSVLVYDNNDVIIGIWMKQQA
ncbi:MAG: hypothetical protein IJ583_00630 [Firmicutes bacterium]|nr:hypothetical protein [Bacillota bacterium]